MSQNWKTLCPLWEHKVWLVCREGINYNKLLFGFHVNAPRKLSGFLAVALSFKSVQLLMECLWISCADAISR